MVWTKKTAQALRSELSEEAKAIIDFLAESPGRKFRALELVEALSLQSEQSLRSYLGKTTIGAKRVGVSQEHSHSWFVLWEDEPEWRYWLDEKRSSWWLSGVGWSDEELEAAVQDYLEMLSLHRQGTKFVKKARFESLSQTFGRTTKAFEYRAQNISYVLDLMGRQWLPGLRPAKNVGLRVANQIEGLISKIEGREYTGVVKLAIEPGTEQSKKSPTKSKGATFTKKETPTALFINGIYGSVLEEIVAAQEKRGGGDSFLQPYKGVVITMLRSRPPMPEAPVRLYISTTANLSQVSYTAEIVGWEDKREITQERRKVINLHLGRYQMGETNLFEGVEEAGERAVNLVTIRNLLPLETLYSTSLLTKCSDDLPLKKRTRSGGWSEVFDIGDLLSLPSQTRDRVAVELAAEEAKAAILPASELQRLVSKAPKLPERIQIVSLGFRRSAHVIVAVLRRAKGACERCGKSAPFIRRSDGSPFLEVHHKTPLSQGGEDTVANAAALCPNCHREAHHG